MRRASTPAAGDRRPYPSILGTLGLLGMVVALGAVFVSATLALFPDWPQIAQMAVPTQLALAIIVVWATARSDRPWREALGLQRLPLRYLPPILLVLIGSVTVFSEIYVVIQRVVPVPEEIEQMLRELLEMTDPADRAATLLIAVAIAPVLEETLFRGVLLHGLARRYGPQSASFWTAIFFALFHIYNPWQVVPTFFLGLVLAWLVLTTRTLWASIGVHVLFNAASLALIRVPLEQAAPEGQAIPIVVAVVVLGLLAGSLALLTGMAWLEKLTGGGWFSAAGPPARSGERERAETQAEPGTRTHAGPSAARG